MLGVPERGKPSGRWLLGLYAYKLTCVSAVFAFCVDIICSKIVYALGRFTAMYALQQAASLSKALALAKPWKIAGSCQCSATLRTGELLNASDWVWEDSSVGRYTMRSQNGFPMFKPFQYHLLGSWVDLID